MKIGVFSDIHDNLQNLTLCMEYLKENNINTALFCGDFCSPVPVKKVLKNYQIQIHAVYGNTEDRHLITQICLTEIKNISIYGESAELEFDNRKIALTHYPLYADGLAHTGRYDAVFHGHNHTASENKINNSLVVNPGEILGAMEDAGFAIYDTSDNSVQFIKIKDLLK